MRFGSYTNQEQAAHGYSHWLEVTADDLTSTTVTSAFEITCPFVFQVGDVCNRVSVDLDPAFQQVGTAGNNTLTMSVGDITGAVDSILAAIEVNVNGSEVLHKRAACSGTPLTGFTASSALSVTFTPKSGEAPSSIDAGVAIISLDIDSPQRTAAVIDSVLLGK